MNGFSLFMLNLFLTYIPFSSTLSSFLFVYKRLMRQSKDFSVIGFLLKSNTKTDSVVLSSSNNSAAPSSLIPHPLSLISSKPSQRVKTAATHLAP